MKLSKYLILSFTLITGISSCGRKQENDTQVSTTGKVDSAQTTVSKIESNLPESGALVGDTIVIRGKYVLFFGPSAERIKAQPTDAATLASFRAISESLVDSLNKSGNVTSSFTTAGHVRIYRNGDTFPMTLVLKGFKEPCGMVVTDGSQPPAILKGDHTLNEYQNLIRRIMNFQS